MLTSMSGRSVIVTGASKGIGKGIAKLFCQNGGKVLVVSRNLEEAEGCAEELRRAGGIASSCAGDVTKIRDMQVAADTAATIHGGIDILCANAGIFPQTKIEDLAAEDWDQVMATNLKGTFLAIKACLPHLKKSDQGADRNHVVNHGPRYWFPRLEPLWRDQGWPAWIHAHGLHRTGQVWNHDQCGLARHHSDPWVDRSRAGIRAFDSSFHPAEEARYG